MRCRFLSVVSNFSVINEMLCVDKKSYNLRNRRSTKRKQIISEEKTIIDKKRLRNFDHITSLPDEILLVIFSFLSIEDLYFNVRPVCRKWRRLSMIASAWSNINVGNDIPTNILKNWIQFSPVIKRFKISNRNDADVILNNISKFSTNLQVIIVENCWGSEQRVQIHSGVLCNLLVRCKKLVKIHFERVKIRSCKFFKLLAKKRTNGKFLHLCYMGPVTVKQYNTLKESCSGWIFTEFVEVV